MIPHIQTDTSKENGNCWQTAIASILEQPVERVPHFLDINIELDQDWWDYTTHWLWHHGFTLENVRRHLYTDEDYLVCGFTVRDTYHVCVYRNGQMVHDPHPEGPGLTKEDTFLAIRQR